MVMLTHTIYRHEALLYRSVREFVDVAVPFVREGLRCGQPATVAVAGARLDALRGDVARRRSSELRRHGRDRAQPCPIIPAWLEFVSRHEGKPLRGIGEPIWAGRSNTEIEECQLHEVLLNRAVRPGSPRPICPYDVSVLEPAGAARGPSQPPCHRRIRSVPGQHDLRGVPRSSPLQLALDRAGGGHGGTHPHDLGGESAAGVHGGRRRSGWRRARTRACTQLVSPPSSRPTASVSASGEEAAVLELFRTLRGRDLRSGRRRRPAHRPASDRRPGTAAPQHPPRKPDRGSRPGPGRIRPEPWYACIRAAPDSRDRCRPEPLLTSRIVVSRPAEFLASIRSS